ncbi:MAG: hypothetical protein JJU22_15990, partial [Gammaproteobacteria bacterium]|nr:hypothetical protein [Gammaproteobacteria bacterium]
MKVASYAPGQTGSVQFAISADDCLLHFDAEQLTAKQRADDKANKDLIAMLQCASQFIARPGDRVALYEGFDAAPWRATLARYQGFFAELGLDPVTMDACSFHPREGFYAPLASAPPPTDLVAVYLISGSNRVLHQGTPALAISQDVNSKMTLARDAAGRGIPVPASLVLRHDELGGEQARRFLAQAGGPVMLKVMGLAGARNVTTIASIDEARAYLAEYEPELEVLLQERLDPQLYTEMTADLRVADAGIEIANVRRILFEDGLWVGNHISDRIPLSDRQRAALIRIGEYVRSKGYSAAEGLNCGIDFFVRGDDIMIIEINARWTGGLMPAEMVSRLGIGDGDTVVAFDSIAT